VERSDGRLAKVSYLFGVPESTETTPSEPAPSDESDRVGDTAGPAANGRTPASGWYIEPGSDAPSSRDDEPVDGVDDEPEAPAIAAARRFLSAVESSVAERHVPESPETETPHATGVRFVAADEPEATAPKPPAVRKASINALARKGMSSAEMTTLLENREIEPDEVAAEVERLEGAGLLDDRVLAHDLVTTLRERKGLGKSAITAELRRRRVDQNAIDEALESVDVDDELERATEVAIKRAGQLSSYDRTTAERRLSAFLQRRGYSGSVVGAAVNAALGPAGPRFR
jgi:regulatory protein